MDHHLALRVMPELHCVLLMLRVFMPQIFQPFLISRYVSYQPIFRVCQQTIIFNAYQY
jgi:hypothetical protein